jgi:hypothetical protein
MQRRSRWLFNKYNDLGLENTMRRALQILLLSVAYLGAAQGAKAQSRLDIFAGYSYMRSNVVVSGPSFNLNGGSASLAYNFNDWIGVAGDIGFYHQGRVTGSGLSLSLASYQIGPRLSYRKNEHLVPFTQLLFGAGRAGGTLYTNSLGTDLAPLGTNNSFLLTAGGGVDWKVNHTIAVRLVQAEYVYSQFLNGIGHDNRQNSVRLSTGIVFSFGTR